MPSTNPPPAQERVDVLARAVRDGSYKVDTWLLAQVLLAHPEARKAMGLSPVTIVPPSGPLTG